MGIIVATMILVYILISFGVSFLIYKFSKKKILSFIIFILLVTFPFWDLIVQKSIKNYYINSEFLKTKIYSYPEKDRSGLIDGLNLKEVTKRHIYWLKDNETTRELLIKTYSFSADKDLKFLDIRFKYGDYPNYTYKTLQFSYDSLTRKPIYKYVENSNCRYKIIFKDTNKLFGLYSLRKYQVIDIKTNKVLSETGAILFSNKFAYIRTNIFFFVSYAGNPISFIDNIGNWFSLIEIFGLKYID